MARRSLLSLFCSPAVDSPRVCGAWGVTPGAGARGRMRGSCGLWSSTGGVRRRRREAGARARKRDLPCVERESERSSFRGARGGETRGISGCWNARGCRLGVCECVRRDVGREREGLQGERDASRRRQRARATRRGGSRPPPLGADGCRRRKKKRLRAICSWFDGLSLSKRATQMKHESEGSACEGRGGHRRKAPPPDAAPVRRPLVPLSQTRLFYRNTNDTMSSS